MASAQCHLGLPLACSVGPNDGDALLPFRTLGVLCRTPGRGRAVPPYGGGLDRTPLACSMRTPRRASGPRRATGLVVVVASLLAPFVRYLVPRRLRVRSELRSFVGTVLTVPAKRAVPWHFRRHAKYARGSLPTGGQCQPSSAADAV